MMQNWKHHLWAALFTFFLFGVNLAHAQPESADILPYSDSPESDEQYQRDHFSSREYAEEQAQYPSTNANSYSAPSASLNSGYTLGSGDLISINVFGEEDLSIEEIRLTDAGTFSYPFLGEIQAKGRTSAQVEAMIRAGLQGDYLIDPKVSVSILEYRPFYVNGEVKQPGGYPFKPGLTIRKAIALAGGFTERASRSKFYLIRDTDPSRTPVRVTLESGVYPGDIITINESFF